MRRLLVFIAVFSLVLAACESRQAPISTPGGTTAATDSVSYEPFRPDHDPDTAAFRTECEHRRTESSDPIVSPGAKSMHEHEFYGSGEDPRAVPFDPMNGDDSSCNGGVLNKSLYWFPSMLLTNTYDQTDGKFDRIPPLEDGEWGNPLQVYYKSGYHGVSPGNLITQWLPNGLRMVAGNPNATEPQPTTHVWWSCITGSQVDHYATDANGNYINKRNALPLDCEVGENVQMAVEYPNCWDGVNLDSPTHGIDPAYPHGGGTPYVSKGGSTNPGVGHMAYPLEFQWPTPLGCPNSHPIPVPEVTQFHRTPVPPSGAGNMRLASDHYNGPAGYTIHGDVWVGWDPPTAQSIIDTCYNPTPHDCSMNIFDNPAGDGSLVLADPTPGG
jgi:hypothetical protein